MITGKDSRIVVYWCGILALLTLDVQCADNLALYKPANQTGVYEGLTADRAVDGRYGESDGDQDYCAHPDNRANKYKPAEWWVDLQDQYIVDHITIYNTYNDYGHYRMTGFVLSVGVTMDTRTDCNQPSPDIVPRGGNVTIQCDIRGRFVHFRRVYGYETSLVNLCEVEVYGRKDIGSIPYLPYYVTVITFILCLVIIVTLSVFLWKSRSALAKSNKREQSATPCRTLSTDGSRLNPSAEGPFQNSNMGAEASGSITTDRHDSSVALSNRRETEYEDVSSQVHYEALSNENRGVYQNNDITGPYTELKATRN